MRHSNSRGIALGKYIRELRISRRISTLTMATALEISESHYIQYETGTSSIYVEHLVIISSILDIDIKHLLNAFEGAEKNIWI
ncbi:helix-turn-helix domain-containing protein [Providencia vermicola]|uniref:Helix-turn-helix transcriptional regulator n=3 Tax=Providencia TaxID=586 RepID=A0AAI9I343_PROST|nr:MULTISPECIES: helix-turn-helix transcriptional regulator [Providencia]ELR5045513.1 helix-turn-helix transcriptional regulator [Providencia rettgeri]ELR5037409.1 helix-turn-helix transcriptional regulator [Providencia stuartii]ELR5120164.1 helix-turn-helix transcriptional regulator [Providencia stuartii]ELR5143549.1 helix-turn-helix transcriptional regulator [Providencia stuartii]ELR5292234.1 helix-turn-helix transcriptional regulator [Providencia stuartii]